MNAEKNFENLQKNAYPGRGIVMGLLPNGDRIQIYWIMGRSENSKNRIFAAKEDGSVKTEAFDISKLKDPSLIIYSPLRQVNGIYIISNGDQTDTVADFLKQNKPACEALQTRTYEPDSPNWTPRISGAFYPNGAYFLSIIKSDNSSDANPPKRSSICLERECGTKGFGEMITTYEGDSDPLVSFEGLPRIVPLKASAEENLEFYWNALNPKFRVSILVNQINAATNQSRILIKNANI